MLRDRLIPEFEQEITNTRKLLQLVPQEKFDYKPHPKSMTMGRLAGHVGELTGWVKTTMTMEHFHIEPDQRFPQLQSMEAILEAFDKSAEEAKGLLAAATDEALLGNWTMTFGSQTIVSRPRIEVLRNFVTSHMIHHRGQLTVYLRLNEIAFPGMYGPSADEMKFWEKMKADAAGQKA